MVGISKISAYFHDFCFNSSFLGFRGDGIECADVDECADRALHECVNSDCENIGGSYICNCHEGTDLILMRTSSVVNYCFTGKISTQNRL